MKDNDSTRIEPGEDPQDLSGDRAADLLDVALVEGEDYYLENGLLVFTESFLRRRGYCCDSGCRHCPYPKESL